MLEAGVALQLGGVDGHGSKVPLEQMACLAGLPSVPRVGPIRLLGPFLSHQNLLVSSYDSQ